MKANFAPERLGAFGFSWQEKIAKNIGYPVTLLNASKYGKIVDNMYKSWKAGIQAALPEKEILDKIKTDTMQLPQYIVPAIVQFRIKDNLGAGAIPDIVEANAKPTSIIKAVTGFNDPVQAVAGVKTRNIAFAAILAGLGYLTIKNMMKKKTLSGLRGRA